MTNYDENWDYWEKRRHDNAHFERDGGCLGPLVGILLLFFLAFPATLIATDFYAQVLCEWKQIACTQHLIEWKKSIAQRDR